jgi:hypothetical protein
MSVTITLDPEFLRNNLKNKVIFIQSYINRTWNYSKSYYSGFSSQLPSCYCGERGIISTSYPQFSMVFGSNPRFSSQLPSCYCGERGIISTSYPQFSMVFGSNPGFSSQLPSFYCGERGIRTPVTLP